MTLWEIFQDDTGAYSAGRVYSAYCVVAALCCWTAGIWLPLQAAHAQSGMEAFLTAAATFYGAGKAAERFGKRPAGDDQ